jgi:hypothetical protein
LVSRSLAWRSREYGKKADLDVCFQFANAGVVDFEPFGSTTEQNLVRILSSVLDNLLHLVASMP